MVMLCSAIENFNSILVLIEVRRSRYPESHTHHFYFFVVSALRSPNDRALASWAASQTVEATETRRPLPAKPHGSLGLLNTFR
jgi:hypothetical protein